MKHEEFSSLQDWVFMHFYSKVERQAVLAAMEWKFISSPSRLEQLHFVNNWQSLYNRIK